jgi:type II secretory pathway pseudopilin PulG
MAMIFQRLGSINKNQIGITLMELLVAMLISSIITGAITTTLFQVVTGSTRTNNHMIAVREARSAGYWVSHDALMAQDIAVATEPGFPFTLTWSDWTNDEVNTVVYSIVDGDLQRAYSINSGVATTDIVAEFIDLGNTSCEYIGGKLIFTVTTNVGSGSQQETETRRYEIVPRTGS